MFNKYIRSLIILLFNSSKTIRGLNAFTPSPTLAREAAAALPFYNRIARSNTRNE